MKLKAAKIIILILLFFTGIQAQNIEWFSLGTGLNTRANAVAVLGNDVYVGGIFATAGGTLVNNIAKWDGNQWSSLAGGTNGDVFALAVIGNEVYAAGSFSSAGGVPANNIAKWDGSAWSPLGTGLNQAVLCLAVDGNNLYAGGFFTEAGGMPASRIAKWDGSSWSGLGSGINNEVNAIAVSGSELYAGGIFNLAGGVNVSGLARWDGINWFDVGGGVNGIVRSISINGNDVYVGGVFTMAGGNVPGRIVRWDGSTWHQLGSGVNGSVFSLNLSGNDLYVGGLFTTAGNQTANRIAKYNVISFSWSPVGEGASGSVDAMAVQTLAGSMIIAGSFTQVGGGINANYVARFTDSENPLPVELNKFSYFVSGNSVVLSWITSSENNNFGFEVERKVFNLAQSTFTDWTKTGFVQGNGTTTELSNYTFTDQLNEQGKYLYRLKQIDFDGSISYSNEIEVDFIGVTEFALQQNYPNPFNPSTAISFYLPEGDYVSLKIFDVLGREIAAPLNEFLSAGKYEVSFDGSRLSSGTYFYTIIAGRFVQTKKMLLLK